jgi:hypothetical protein
MQRGSITFWLTDDFEKVWLYIGEKQRGSQFDSSEQAIEIMLKLPGNSNGPINLVLDSKV